MMGARSVAAVTTGRMRNVANSRSPKRSPDTLTPSSPTFAATRLNWLERAAAVDDDAAHKPLHTARGVLTQQQVLEAQSGQAAQHGP